MNDGNNPTLATPTVMLWKDEWTLVSLSEAIRVTEFANDTGSVQQSSANRMGGAFVNFLSSSDYGLRKQSGLDTLEN